MPDSADMIAMKDAVFAYRRTRQWFHARITDGLITAYRIVGDPQTYLSRKELDKLLQFRPISPAKNSETSA